MIENAILMFPKLNLAIGSSSIRAAYPYNFFDIDADTGTAFWYQYQFYPYRDIHITILPWERPF